MNNIKNEEQVYVPQRRTAMYKKDHYVDYESYENMIVAKSLLLKNVPFWGLIAMSIPLVEEPLESMPTMATDGMHIFYNPDFVKTLNRDELIFGLAHELNHVIKAHVGDNSRLFARESISMSEFMQNSEYQEKARIWNCAADYVNNDELVLSNIGRKITTIEILHDEKYRGWTTEEVYDHLMENPDELPAGAASFDEHIQIEIVPDDDMDEQGGYSDGNTFKISESEYQKFKKDLQSTIMSAAAAQQEHEMKTGESAGCIPASIKRLIEKLSTPLVDWKTSLRRAVVAVNTRNFSFSRPHRGHFQQGITIPGFRSRTQKLDLAVMVDTSGSISSEQLTRGISELKGILESFATYKIDAWCFDSDVAEDSFLTVEKNGSKSTWRDILEFTKRIQGGGGTSFETNWHFMIDRKIKPKACIMFTDGYPFGSWGFPNYCPTIFVVMDNPQCTAPFGKTIHIGNR